MHYNIGDNIGAKLMQKLQNLKQNTNTSKQLQLTEIIEGGKKILLSK